MLKRYCLVLLFQITTLISSAQITQPAQPSYGPGGNNYTHSSYDSSRYENDITNMYWLFEPAAPKPDSVLVVILFHGNSTTLDST